MTTRYFPLFCLLILLIMHGCAPYQKATPYPRKEPSRPTGEPEGYRPDTPKPAQPPIDQKKPSHVRDISRQAERQVSDGQLQAAAQTVERGLRVAPKDALLWSQLADIRLRQKLYQQALSLAAKSNSLAGGNEAIINRNQRIIEQAQRNQR